MKKRNLFFAAMAAVMSFTACSSKDEDGPNPGLDGKEAVQEIVLQVSSVGDGMQTRAGRELLSDEAGQDIDYVSVVICDNTGKVVRVKKIGWKDNEGVSVYPSPTSADGTQYKYALTADYKLPAGIYTAYAIGYSKDSNYDISKISNLKDPLDLQDGETYPVFSANTVLTYSKKDEKMAEEIFAGSVVFQIKKDFDRIENNATLILNRQVAGIYVYTKNIPYYDDVNLECKLQLVAADTNNKLVLGHFANTNLTENGNNTGDYVKYVVNGTTDASTATETVIFNEPLSNWYTKIQDADKDGIVDCKEGDKTIWKNKSRSYHYQKGSIFLSTFIIPFQKVSDSKTLKLRLVTKDGNAVKNNTHKGWIILTPDKGTKLGYWDLASGKFIDAESYSEDNDCYSIVRNHLYSIGTKAVADKKKDPKPDDPENPDDPDDPDDPDPENPVPEIDDPTDLSKTQTILLQLNDNWEVIHKMEVD